ncbi:MAG TPA: type II toxin-antitoxin system PemK/MazF family toxin [Thermoanaerobaculia bacterium]
MIRLNVGAVVWIAQFNYAGRPDGKTAPGVVLSSHRYHEERRDAIVARITSKMHHAPGFGAVVIRDWAASGLDKPSVIKPFLMTVEQAQIVRVAGQLDAATVAELKRAFKAVFPFAT